MTYREWVLKHGHIDSLVKGELPTDKEVGLMTDDEFIEKYSQSDQESR